MLSLREQLVFVTYLYLPEKGVAHLVAFSVV